MCLFVCLFADISEITKFGMLIPHIKGAYCVKEILKYRFISEIPNFEDSRLSQQSQNSFICLRKRAPIRAQNGECTLVHLFIIIYTCSDVE